MITVYSAFIDYESHPVTPNYLWIDGDRYVVFDGDDVPVIAACPLVITIAQARLALLQLGLLDTVNNAISSYGQSAQINWNYQPTIHRDNALVAAIALTLSWTDAQLDAMFKLAATFN